MGRTIFHRDDLDLIAAFAGCSLDEKPGSNWVQDAGGLPTYICEIARAIKRSGKTTSQAISIAVSRVKKWASGVGVDTDTQAKAAKALAQWEALKVKARAKTAGKKSGHVLAATAPTGDQILCFTTTTEFNVDNVRSAFEERQRTVRRAWFKANPNGKYDEAPELMYVREQWTTYIIASAGYGTKGLLYKIPYTVDTSGDVTFAEATQVKTEYVVVDDADMPGSELTDTDLKTLMDTTTVEATAAVGALDRVVTFAAGR